MNPSPRGLEQTSEIAASAEEVWARVVTPEGINDEMRPWITMSMPRRSRGMAIDTIVVGQPLGRAWLRLFGVVPIDYDHLTIVALEPGRSFHERSTMLSMTSWEHERTVTPLAGGVTRVHDRVTFVPRALLRPLGGVLLRAITAFFAHRHRRLRRHFS